MYILVLAHPGCPRQSPESHKMVVCVCVCVCVAYKKNKDDTYFLGMTRSTSTDSAPAMVLSLASEDDMSALRLRSRSFDAKFSFVAITFGAMPNSLKSCKMMQAVYSKL